MLRGYRKLNGKGKINGGVGLATDATLVVYYKQQIGVLNIGHAEGETFWEWHPRKHL